MSPSPLTLLALAALAFGCGLLFVPILARRVGRPPFVVGLCVAAVAVAAIELVYLALAPSASVVASALGVRLVGRPAQVVVLAHAAVQIAVGCGLWVLRPWARLAAMGYLGYLLASFLLWGLGGGHGRDAWYMLAWQLCVLPFLTFSFMYLYRGGRYFGPRRSRPSVPDS